MAGVDVTPIPGRVGQKLRNELIFANTGGGNAAPTRYRLDIVIKESVTDQLVQITGDATGQVYQLDATFKLVDAASGKVVLQGKAISRAPYNRFQEIFANVRARYDAENRAARTVVREHQDPGRGLSRQRRLGVIALVCPSVTAPPLLQPWSPTNPQPLRAS